MHFQDKGGAVHQRPDRRAETIRLSVRYLQLLGAFDAGFAADPTCNSEFAGVGHHVPDAFHLLGNLSDLGNGEPRTADELRALVAVVQGLYGLRDTETLAAAERDFILLFAGEVAAYFEAQAAQRE